MEKEKAKVLLCDLAQAGTQRRPVILGEGNIPITKEICYLGTYKLYSQPQNCGTRTIKTSNDERKNKSQFCNDSKNGLGNSSLNIQNGY